MSRTRLSGRSIKPNSDICSIRSVGGDDKASLDVLSRSAWVSLDAVSAVLAQSLTDRLDLAQYEEEILNLPPAHSEGESQERARAVTQYYIARTELVSHLRRRLDPLCSSLMCSYFVIRGSGLGSSRWLSTSSSRRSTSVDSLSWDRKRCVSPPRLSLLSDSRMYAPFSFADPLRGLNRQIYDLIIVAQEIANYYLGPSTMDRDGERPAEVGLAEKGVKADEWLTRALKLGDTAARVGGPGHGGKVRVSTRSASYAWHPADASALPWTENRGTL